MTNSIFGGSPFDGIIPVLDKENASDFENYLLSLNYNRIGDVVDTLNTLNDELINNISAHTRRKVKKSDILIVSSLDEEQLGNEGIVFCEDRMVYWNPDKSQIQEIFYRDIESVDFDDEDIIVKSSNDTLEVKLGEDAYKEEYPKYMYNFIMDILDYKEEHENK